LLELTLQNVLVLLTIQFGAFGWRINREIAVGDQNRRTWFPVPDVLNVVSMIIVLAMAVIAPLAQTTSTRGNFQFPSSARAAFAAGIVLLVFHPLAMVAHYGLLNRKGRCGFLKNGLDDYPYFPLQERVVVGLAILAALATAGYVLR
jgi:hypothetical protein